MGFFSVKTEEYMDGLDYIVIDCDQKKDLIMLVNEKLQQGFSVEDAIRKSAIAYFELPSALLTTLITAVAIAKNPFKNLVIFISYI